ncbi:hypothetical protein PGTUg99_024707 [Puccinia graminis f. sp. tritici]|uniref:Uncharacterized protein n=1 Tax=Puccinia graminis f. sp. tritici TaxID=56615 RepID=A0A5B0RGC2_PUCGR|nr:hypothetical protein PGTUg99_016106 [Puccinia graminis f. sp. tritici]KAA1137842.1 hypothetical protein PGTUg99_024707 [Puccinia graminis f. sp. tritici]
MPAAGYTRPSFDPAVVGLLKAFGSAEPSKTSHLLILRHYTDADCEPPDLHHVKLISISQDHLVHESAFTTLFFYLCS